MSIKIFIEEENNKGNVRFRIIEIESKFSNEIPLSNMTLKIAIN